MNLLKASLPRSMGIWLRLATSVSNDFAFYSLQAGGSEVAKHQSIELKSKLLAHTLAFSQLKTKTSSSTLVSLSRSMPQQKPRVRLALKCESSTVGQHAGIVLHIYGGSRPQSGKNPKPSCFSIRLDQELLTSLPQLRLSFFPSRTGG